MPYSLPAHTSRRILTLAAVATLGVAGCGTTASADAETNATTGKLIKATSMDGHQLRQVPADEAPTVALEMHKDTEVGWNVQLVADRFDFTLEHAGQAAKPQEGHAHLYVDGEKVARIYGPWYHLSTSLVPPGEHVLTVTLNSNDHTTWAVDGEPIQDSTVIKAPGESESHKHHGHEHGGHSDEHTHHHSSGHRHGG